MILNDLYDYGLKIYQNDEYFKFSLDSILLAEFIKVQKGYKVLDLCTGNAPIPLILSTKNIDIEIDALELQKPIYELARKSIEFNKLEKIITVYNVDAKSYKTNKKYDVITCNPPYFKESSTSIKNTNEIKKIARHEVAITLEDIIRTSKENLKETGSFFMVHRVERLLETIKLLEKYKFGIRKVVFAKTKNGRKLDFFLIEASNYKKSDLKVETIDVLRNTSYKDIFKEE